MIFSIVGHVINEKFQEIKSYKAETWVANVTIKEDCACEIYFIAEDGNVLSICVNDFYFKSETAWDSMAILLHTSMFQLEFFKQPYIAVKHLSQVTLHGAPLTTNKKMQKKLHIISGCSL